MMGVMVEMSNGDVERFEHAAKYESGVTPYVGYLFVQNDDGSQVATFAPGGWSAAWVHPIKRAVKADTVEGSGLGRTIRQQIGDDVSVTVTVDGQQIRRVANEQIDEAMNALVSSIARQKS